MIRNNVVTDFFHEKIKEYRDIHIDIAIITEVNGEIRKDSKGDLFINSINDNKVGAIYGIVVYLEDISLERFINELKESIKVALSKENFLLDKKTENNEDKYHRAKLNLEKNLRKLDSLTINNIKPIDEGGKYYPLYWGKEQCLTGRIRKHLRTTESGPWALSLDYMEYLDKYSMLYGSIMVKHYDQFETLLHQNHESILGDKDKLKKKLILNKN